NLSLADRYLHPAAVLHGAEHDVALELIEEFLPGIDVVVLSRVGSADHHDDEVAVLEHSLVAHGRLEHLPVLIDPAVQVERLQVHGLTSSFVRRLVTGARHRDRGSAGGPRAIEIECRELATPDATGV